MEAEYIAASEAAKEAVWLKNFLLDLEVVPSVQSEPRSHKRGKHIERKYHLICEIVSREDAVVSQIVSEDNLAYHFTKGLAQKIFDQHIKGMGVKYRAAWF